MTHGHLQRYMALSLAIHLAFITAFFVTIQKRSMFVMPSPYMVKLVTTEPAKKKRRSVNKRPSTTKTAKKKTAVKKAQPKAAPKPAPKAPGTDRAYVSDRLAAISSKTRIKRKLRDKAPAPVIKPAPAPAPAAAQDAAPQALADLSDPIIADYYQKIEPHIWREWAYPQSGETGLEAVVSIHIAKDGAITEKKLEKSSGNRRFDSSAMRALTKASPLEPPPYEMNLGVRFHL